MGRRDQTKIRTEMDVVMDYIIIYLKTISEENDCMFPLPYCNFPHYAHIPCIVICSPVDKSGITFVLMKPFVVEGMSISKN